MYANHLLHTVRGAESGSRLPSPYLTRAALWQGKQKPFCVCQREHGQGWLARVVAPPCRVVPLCWAACVGSATSTSLPVGLPFQEMRRGRVRCWCTTILAGVQRKSKERQRDEVALGHHEELGLLQGTESPI